MSNEVIKAQTPYEIIGIAAGVFNSLPPLAQGWLTMASVKKTVFDQLQKDELAIQEKLNSIAIPGNPNMTAEALNAELKKIQETIAAGKSIYAESKAMRINFTNEIDERLIKAAMAFEKRSEILINEATAKELEFRKVVVAKNSEGEAKQTELNQLEAHIKNEWYRIAAKYRADLDEIITVGYTDALKQKQSPDTIGEYMEVVKQVLTQTELDGFIVFKRTLVDDAEAGKLFAGIPQYDPAADLQAAYVKLNEAFSMYAEDLKNSEAAIKEQEAALQERQQEAAQDVEITTATNNLTAHAGGLSFSGGPAIKNKVEVLEENNETWALAVLNAFIKNWKECREFLGVRTWSKLTIGQMAVALGKLAMKQNKTGKKDLVQGAVFTGLTLKVIEK